MRDRGPSRYAEARQVHLPRLTQPIELQLPQRDQFMPQPVRNTLHRLWREESGFVVTSDLILVATVVVIGSIVGLVTFRDQLVQEFGDMAAAVGALNQSYSYAEFTVDGFTVAGSSFEDQSDFCDEGDLPMQPAECISVTEPASPEG